MHHMISTFSAAAVYSVAGLAPPRSAVRLASTLFDDVLESRTAPRGGARPCATEDKAAAALKVLII